MNCPHCPCCTSAQWRAVGIGARRCPWLLTACHWPLSFPFDWVWEGRSLSLAYGDSGLLEIPKRSYGPLLRRPNVTILLGRDIDGLLRLFHSCAPETKGAFDRDPMNVLIVPVVRLRKGRPRESGPGGIRGSSRLAIGPCAFLSTGFERGRVPKSVVCLRFPKETTNRC